MICNRNFTNALILFFIICCVGERTNSLTIPNSTFPSSDPFDIFFSNTTTDDSSSTVFLDSEQTNTTTVHESTDLPTSSSKTTIKISESSETLDISTSSISSSSPTHPSSRTFLPTSPTSLQNSTTSSTNSTSNSVNQSTHPDLYSKSGAKFHFSVRCPKGSIDEYGTDGERRFKGNTGKHCTSAHDCLNVGWARNKSRRLDITCVMTSSQEDTGCCYSNPPGLKNVFTSDFPEETVGLCSQGVSALPLRKCESLDDCNLHSTSIHITTHRWCDPVSKTCCRFGKEHDMFCPDNTIALMNEPLCTGYRMNDIWSGKCPDERGICKYGHCCPTNKTDNVLPGPPYQTNQECTSNTVISKNQIRGYCDPDTERIFIMSEVNFSNQTNKALPFHCLSGRDCGQTYGTNNVCVRTEHDSLQCYINPKVEYHTPHKPSLFWLSAFSYLAVGTSILALIFTIIYRIYKVDDSFPGERSATSELSQPLVSDQ